MKISRIFACLSFALFANFTAFSSFAKIQDSFFLESFATLEYSAPRFYGNQSAKHFGTDSIFTQIKNFDNIALGLHGRIHKHFGLNANWSQSDLSSTALEGKTLSKKAGLALDYYNISALFFAPLLEDSLVEAFGEIGVSMIKSRTTVFETNGDYTKQASRKNIPFFGVGFQVAPFENSKDAFRFTFQRQLQKLDVVEAYFSTIRVGYVKEF